MIPDKPYDSTEDTLKHIQQVQGLMNVLIAELDKRAEIHDASKLESPEKEVFDEFTPKLKALTYGSDEYKDCLKQMGVGLAHHYKVNSHHPEHYSLLECNICFAKFPKNYDERCSECGNGGFTEIPNIRGMSLLDLIEMVADWKAASLRHADGDFHKSLYINKERFRIPDSLFEIILHTVGELGW